ncbi:MAG: hypothetical protein K9J12_08205 [Melioribacteraceae bacterium]|nr:hypothetical protein [Melioribacteraceae bacterium]MCF8264111.1 hypothetical protein [Melioribacteraceae bacterium]MCF8413335.1 hypothetical protein [Melioribacteraceae bacterium]MCF8431482.1 hypothetical protein [Melioribacteraceae bacterium]
MTIPDRIDFLIRYRLKFLPSFFKKSSELKEQFRQIYFFPNFPHKRTVIYKICRRLGIKILISEKNNENLQFFWDDSTNYEKPIDSANSINAGCTNISKDYVDSIFRNVFGYGVNIDPKNYEGKCVIKSKENAQHDGRIIDCPTEFADDSFVYQTILNNEEDDLVKDIRTPIFGNKLPLVYLKYKTMEKRFTNDILKVEVKRTNEIFSREEENNILSFAKNIGLDYGELDIIRNKDDGRIYIIDVNKTPWGPPATISEKDYEFVLQEMSKAFIEEFLN